jgi:hypothetical protein
MAETGSFDLARVDVPSGRLCRSPMQWAELQGVAEVTELLMALRQQGRALPHRTASTHSLDRQDGPQVMLQARGCCYDSRALYDDFTFLFLGLTFCPPFFLLLGGPH